MSNIQKLHDLICVIGEALKELAEHGDQLEIAPIEVFDRCDEALKLYKEYLKVSPRPF